jgi:hypothetical protein
MVEDLGAASVAAATAAILQTITSASQAASLAYLASVQQLNATATLELSTLAAACQQVLSGRGHAT